MRLASPSDAWGAECQWQTPGMSCDILMNPVGKPQPLLAPFPYPQEVEKGVSGREEER